jgi:hypothetical protein
VGAAEIVEIAGALYVIGAPAVSTGYVQAAAPMTYNAPAISTISAAPTVYTEPIAVAPTIIEQPVTYVEQPIVMQAPVIQQAVVERPRAVNLPHPGGLPDPDPIPETETEEHVIEVPTTLFYEKVVEVPKYHTTTLKKQKLGMRDVHKRVKEVVVPVTDVVVKEQVKRVKHKVT